METALVLPVLLLLTFGILEYGWMYSKAAQVQSAARHGARVGIRVDSTRQDVVDAVDGYMARHNLGDSGYTLTLEPTDPAAMGWGDTLSVHVSMPYDGNLDLTGFPLLPVPDALSSRAAMAKESP